MPEKYCTHVSYKTTAIPNCAVDYFFFICMYLHKQPNTKVPKFTYTLTRQKKINAINIDYLIVAT